MELSSTWKECSSERMESAALWGKERKKRDENGLDEKRVL